jgi:hypothetical protein
MFRKQVSIMPFVLSSPWRVGVRARFDWSLTKIPQAILLPKNRFSCVRISGLDITELRGLDMHERRELAENFNMRALQSPAAAPLMRSMEFAARHDALLKIVTTDNQVIILACDSNDAASLLTLSAEPPPNGMPMDGARQGT